MLVNVPIVSINGHPILQLIAGGKESEEVCRGVYRTHHFGSSSFLKEQGFIQYPIFDELLPSACGMGKRRKDEDGTVFRNAYGVCDSLRQLLKHFPELEGPEREFVVTLNEIRKEYQPEDGGWRWHKWGPYIGTQDPQCEYIYDEPEIQSVFVYHIYERIDFDKIPTVEMYAAYTKKFGRNCRIWEKEDFKSLPEQEQRQRLISSIWR